jgi:hypothetical protein
VTFLSFLQDGCNRLLLESLVVLSLESHVGSVYRSSRLSIRSAIKKPPKNSPAENRISSEFLDFTPFYRVERGKQKGTLKEFLFVSRGEYDRVGYKAAKRIEYDRIRSRRIATNSTEKARLSARRAERRKNEPGLRERERTLDNASQHRRRENKKRSTLTVERSK